MSPNASQSTGSVNASASGRDWKNLRIWKHSCSGSDRRAIFADESPDLRDFFVGREDMRTRGGGREVKRVEGGVGGARRAAGG